MEASTPPRPKPWGTASVSLGLLALALSFGGFGFGLLGWSPMPNALRMGLVATMPAASMLGVMAACVGLFRKEGGLAFAGLLTCLTILILQASFAAWVGSILMKGPW